MSQVSPIKNREIARNSLKNFAISSSKTSCGAGATTLTVGLSLESCSQIQGTGADLSWELISWTQQATWARTETD